MSSTDVTTAVVLSGGASQGAYHAGVLKALFQGESPATNYESLDPQVITGTSAGSFNAVMLLSQIEQGQPKPAESVEELWLERIARTGTSCGNGAYRFRGSPTHFVDPGCLFSNPVKPILELFDDANFLLRESLNRGRQFITATAGLSQRVLDQLNLSTFVATDRLRQVVEESVHFDLIQRSERFIRVGAVDWDTGDLRYFTNQDMTVDVGPRIIQASSAVPGLFPRVSVNGVPYGDGGVVENSPLNGAVEAGADVIHVITSFPPARNIPPEAAINSSDTLFRMLVINLFKSLQRNVERIRNVNDGLFVLELMERDGVTGDALTVLRKTLDGILLNETNVPRRQMTVHVHRPPEPLARLLDMLNFDREYLQTLARSGYHDTVAHNCRVNGCVLPRYASTDLAPPSLAGSR